MEKSLLSVVKAEPPNFLVNICWEGDMEEFFKLEREVTCRYFMKGECRSNEAKVGKAVRGG